MKAGEHIAGNLLFLTRFRGEFTDLAVDYKTGDIYRGYVGYGFSLEAETITLPRVPNNVASDRTWRRWAAECMRRYNEAAAEIASC